MKIRNRRIRFLLKVANLLLKSRYNVDIKGLDVINNDTPKLFLPNHQAIVDPILILPQIYKVSSAVPVVTEGYFNLPIAKSLFTSWGAISVSDLESGSKDINVLEEVTSKTLECLKRGENVVIYPSGQLTGQGYEKIINKQGAWSIVTSLPEESLVIGVKISGLWGSQWSKAWTGKSPNFGTMALKSISYLILNLLFFVPKRKITIEFADITAETKHKAQSGKNAFNLSLEAFYNSNGEEPVKYIKHYFFSKKINKNLPAHIQGSFADMSELITAKSLDDIPLNTFKKIAHIVATVLNTDETKIEIGSNLMLDLGCDSLNLVEVVTDMEKVFPKVTIPEITAIRTISDLCLSTMGLLEAKIVYKEQYFTQPIKIKSRIKVDDSIDIVTQFISKVKESPNEWFSYDEMLGSTTRRDFFLKALVLSEVIKKKTSGKHVGILLPALQSSTMLILSTYLANKTPVMLNWTVGAKVLEHCIETAQIDIILSAGKFINKIEQQIPPTVSAKIILLENEIKTISLATKIKSLFYSRFPNFKSIPTRIDDIAVILFTSGSEDLPKAVPLTHKNIVSNLSSVFQSIKLENDLVFIGFLPPFHSFGFTVLAVFPMVSGVRVGYCPDPTDGKSISRLIKHIGGNVILGSPSFLKIVLSNGAKSDFTTLKYAISGAEAMPSALINLFQSQTNGALLLEGYGITECSPILTINSLEKQKQNSVGPFIKGVEGVILRLENGEKLSTNQEGMIYVSGDNIFNGYLNYSTDPFEIINGTKYYKTGDLGYIDDDGFLFITGRLKRFIKIGGEMISLPFIEKILLERYGNDDSIILAVEGSDKVQPPKIVLFSLIELDIDEVNQFLLRSGVSPLAKIKEVIAVTEIPLLGSGKVDYKELKRVIEA